MITDLNLKRFRAFEHLDVHDLGRVNLIVGTNNSGKTSILEAIDILTARTNPIALWTTLNRRGERLWVPTEGTPLGERAEADVCRLFYGHSLIPSSPTEIRGRIDRDKISEVSLRISPKENSVLLIEEPETMLRDFAGELLPACVLQMRWREGKGSNFKPSNDNNSSADFELTARGGLPSPGVAARTLAAADSRKVKFIPTHSLSSRTIVSLFDEISLTRDEDRLITALQIIEPNIERLATKSNLGRRPMTAADRDGIVIKYRGVDRPVPIGSMGDGIWRLLAIALSLIHSENGILLIDEVDTGMHYSVLAEVWKLIFETAERLNVQVFATTHSRDCYEALADVLKKRMDSKRPASASIQRVERGRANAVTFSADEILVAAERAIEVR